MSDKDDEVRYNVKMRRQLRKDAKRNTERGELADAVREVFRRKAYGHGGSKQASELEQTKAELRDVRDRIDDLRRDRGRIENEIEAQERRATRLEERIESLQERHDEMEQQIEMLENMLQNGDRMWPIRIQNAADVDPDTAKQMFQELQDRNAELPEVAFTEPGVNTPADWRNADGVDKMKWLKESKSTQ